MKKLLKTSSFPFLFFVSIFFLFIILAIIHQPGWGLMDDYQNLTFSLSFWEKPHLVNLLFKDSWVFGWFRPVYMTWNVIFYPLFQKFPTGFYIWVYCFNFCSLFLWGRLFAQIFNSEQDEAFLKYIVPLTAFLFTPFLNIFTYLSLQEKFVVFFTPLVLLNYLKAVTYKNISAYLIAVFWMGLGLLSKPTSIYLPFICMVHGLLVLVSEKKEKIFNGILLLSNFLIFTGYSWFTKNYQLKHSYVGKFNADINVSLLVEKIQSGPFVIKSLMALTFVVLLLQIWALIKKENNSVYLNSVLLTAGFSAYLAILLLWSIPSYLMSPLGPLTVGVFLSLFYLYSKQIPCKQIFTGIIAVLLGVVIYGIIVPNISRMKDIADLKIQMKSLAEQSSKPIAFVVSKPNTEAADVLGLWTETDVSILSNNLLSLNKMQDGVKYYLLLNFLGPQINIKNVSIGHPVFHTDTWAIFPVQAAVNSQDIFQYSFPKNFVQKIRDVLKGGGR